MNIKLEPGTYVMAVSGGVDSMVLLHLLMQQQKTDGEKQNSQAKDLELRTRDSTNRHRFIVAHYDHGIRHDSQLDRELVQGMAKKHGLPFVYDEGKLGDVSEAIARKARYNFLHRIREASRARAILTAHHQDDLLETAILNILRGTGRKGLTSMKSMNVVARPLIDIPKKDLINYAQEHNLVWREDITNQDLKYTRNYIRHKILPKFSPTERQMMLGIIKSLHETNREIDNHLVNHLHIHPAINELDRHTFIMLPHSVAREVMATWLRRHQVKDLTSRTLERLVVASKTLRSGQQTDVDKQYVLQIQGKALALTRVER